MIADQISDAILDGFLTEEADALVACEALVSDNLVIIVGEFKTRDEEVNRPPGSVETRSFELNLRGRLDVGDTIRVLPPGLEDNPHDPHMVCPAREFMADVLRRMRFDV